MGDDFLFIIWLSWFWYLLFLYFINGILLSIADLPIGILGLVLLTPSVQKTMQVGFCLCTICFHKVFNLKKKAVSVERIIITWSLWVWILLALFHYLYNFILFPHIQHRKLFKVFKGGCTTDIALDISHSNERFMGSYLFFCLFFFWLPWCLVQIFIHTLNWFKSKLILDFF